jgi:predicted Zn-dependent protease
VSAASFRFRYLLGLLFHVAIGLYGCASHAFVTSVRPPILGSCGEKPSFVDSTQLKRWTSFPVAVSVDTDALPEELRATYREGITRGIGLWSELTRGRIGEFEIRYDRADVPVRISITDDPLPDRAMGTTELTFTGSLIVSARVRLARSRFEGTAFLAQDVASTTAHEIGHVLGIVNHSPDRGDKMWVSGNFGVHNEGRDPASLLTARDVNTLEEAYCR